MASERVAIDAGTVPQAIVGTWKSNGYGLIAQLQPVGSKIYEYTPSRCWSAEEDSAGMIEYVDHYALSADGDQLQLYVVGEPHPYRLRRIPSLPQACRQPLSIAPKETLATFIELMGTHYAFFDRYGVDWIERGKTALATLPADASDAQLFSVMRDSLRGIDDGHLSLAAGENDRTLRYEGNRGRTLNRITERARRSGLGQGKARRQWQQHVWREDIGAALLAGNGTLAGNEFLQFGIVSQDIGYFAASAVGGFASRDFDDPAADLAELDRVLNLALQQFAQAQVKAVILDLSLNHGGFDFIARAIASRFASDTRLAYTKSPADADPAYATDIWIQPTTDKPQWLGPLFVLSSDITVSAGEILLLSLRPYPQVVHVGATSRGSLSDVLGKVLPNGWSLSLSNEVYLDHQGESWEGRGIPPQIAIDPFPENNMDNGFGSALVQLIELIDRRVNQSAVID